MIKCKRKMVCNNRKTRFDNNTAFVYFLTKCKYNGIEMLCVLVDGLAKDELSLVRLMIH